MRHICSPLLGTQLLNFGQTRTKTSCIYLYIVLGLTYTLHLVSTLELETEDFLMIITYLSRHVQRLSTFVIFVQSHSLHEEPGNTGECYHRQYMVVPHSTTLKWSQLRPEPCWPDWKDMPGLGISGRKSVVRLAWHVQYCPILSIYSIYFMDLHGVFPAFCCEFHLELRFGSKVLEIPHRSKKM